MADYFFNIPSMTYQKKRERVYAKIITGENLQCCFVRLEAGEKTYHSHSNEQMGYILSGQVEVMIDGQVKQLTAGDAYHIPSNIPHGFKVLSNDYVEYFEIFSPPKDERSLERAE